MRIIARNYRYFLSGNWLSHIEENFEVTDSLYRFIEKGPPRESPPMGLN
jgi:hypothetical protein